MEHITGPTAAQIVLQPPNSQKGESGTTKSVDGILQHLFELCVHNFSAMELRNLSLVCKGWNERLKQLSILRFHREFPEWRARSFPKPDPATIKLHCLFKKSEEVQPLAAWEYTTRKCRLSSWDRTSDSSPLLFHQVSQIPTPIEPYWLLNPLEGEPFTAEFLRRKEDDPIHDAKVFQDRVYICRSRQVDIWRVTPTNDFEPIQSLKLANVKAIYPAPDGFFYHQDPSTVVYCDQREKTRRVVGRARIGFFYSNGPFYWQKGQSGQWELFHVEEGKKVLDTEADGLSTMMTAVAGSRIARSCSISRQTKVDLVWKEPDGNWSKKSWQAPEKHDLTEIFFLHNRRSIKIWGPYVIVSRSDGKYTVVDFRPEEPVVVANRSFTGKANLLGPPLVTAEGVTFLVAPVLSPFGVIQREGEARTIPFSNLIRKRAVQPTGTVVTSSGRRSTRIAHNETKRNEQIGAKRKHYAS